MTALNSSLFVIHTPVAAVLNIGKVTGKQHLSGVPVNLQTARARKPTQPSFNHSVNLPSDWKLYNDTHWDSCCNVLMMLTAGTGVYLDDLLVWVY